VPGESTVSVHSERKLQIRSGDARIAEVAGAQHGVVARRQLAAIGFGPSAIEMRLARGRLHRLHRGVYAVGHAVVTDRGRWMAAVLAAGRGAMLSHLSAAALLGLRSSAGLTADVTVPRELRSRPGLRFHRCLLPAEEVTVEDGIPVTTPARTLFDLAGVVPLAQLRRAVKEAEVKRLWGRLALPDLLERHPGRPGAAAIRAVIETPDRGVTRNDVEEALAALVRRARLPSPLFNTPLRLGSRFVEPDCMWPEQRVIVEVDGYETHGPRDSFERDRSRDRALTAAGWLVIRVTWRQLRDEPEQIARDLRAVLRRRAGNRSRP
jgi:very-short-patch-repair endonuclease